MYQSSRHKRRFTYIQVLIRCRSNRQAFIYNKLDEENLILILSAQKK